MASILGLGDYQVFLDAGFITNAFVLDDPVQGVLDNPDFVLNGDTEFFDVTDYVQAVGISRGRQKFRDPIDAGRCTIQIYDRDGDFSVVNTNSPYWDVPEDRLGFQPTRRVRIERDGERLFDGQIVTYDQKITLDNKSFVTVVATDDLKVFDRATVNASFTPVQERSDERLETILDLPEVDLFTSPGARVLEPGDALLGTQPVERGVTVAEYFDRVQLCEQGRIFIDRQGRFVAQRRTGRGLRNVVAEFSDVGDGDTPYRNFEVVYE
jgi:hypothetical protein